MTEALLEVRDLVVEYPRRGMDPLRAVDGLGFALAPGATLGIVGESGCGKS
ncbi:MAG TPA: ABC transporter ATP-binding protein, partial [Gammaproteobacteria bacterium]